MKIMTVCWAGLVRSVTLANLLQERGHEAIALGVKTADPGEWRASARWADLIYVVAQKSVHSDTMAKMPLRDRKKVVFVDLKEKGDIWRSPMHPDLVNRLKLLVKELQ